MLKARLKRRYEVTVMKKVENIFEKDALKDLYHTGKDGPPFLMIAQTLASSQVCGSLQQRSEWLDTEGI